MDRIIALARFDGIHMGHVRLMEQARALARKCGVPLWACDLSEFKERILPADETRAMLKSMGADEVTDFLPHAAENEIVAEPGLSLPFSCQRAEPYIYELRPVSRERVLRGVRMGDMKRVRGLLGRPYSLSGRVVRGTRTGHKMGLPTVNLDVGRDIILPCPGVYAARMEIDGEKYLAAANIGVRPTFGQNPTTVESHLLDFDRESYGSLCRLELLEYIRPERAFESAGALAVQIEKDIEAVKAHEKQGS